MLKKLEVLTWLAVDWFAIVHKLHNLKYIGTGWFIRKEKYFGTDTRGKNKNETKIYNKKPTSSICDLKQTEVCRWPYDNVPDPYKLLKQPHSLQAHQDMLKVCDTLKELLMGLDLIRWGI